MIIWLDAQLSPRLARWIEETFEVECVHVRDLGLRNAEDPEIFQKARDAVSVVIRKMRISYDLLSEMVRRRR